jgi:hypothetical protein
MLGDTEHIANLQKAAKQQQLHQNGTRGEKDCPDQ